MPSDQGFVSAPHRQKSHEMRQADSRGSEGVEGMSVPAVLRRATSNGQVSVTLPTDPRLRRGQNLNSEWVTTQGGLSLAQPEKLLTSRVIGVAARAWLTGQPSLAPSAASLNSAGVIPGTVPLTLRTIPVMPVPGWNVTSAEVSREVGGVPALERALDKAIEKQVA